MKKHFLHALTDEHADQAQSKLDRRNFLTSSSLAALGAFFAFHAPGVFAQDNASEIASLAQASLTHAQQFHQLGTWISARPELDPDLSSKAFDAIHAVMPNFSTTLEQLFSILSDEASLSTLLAGAKNNHPECEKECGNPVTSLPIDIYSACIELIQNTTLALYTGQLGSGENAHLIAYEHALMFIPTQDVLFPPSYTHAGRDSWVQPPDIQAMV